MKKLYIITLVVSMTPMSLLLCKEYKHVKTLNNRISRNCHGVRRALFSKGELEVACDYLEEMLELKDKIGNSQEPNSMGEAIFTGGYIDAVFEILQTKAAIRIILADETDAIKYKEYDELTNLAHKLKDNYSAREEAERQKAEKEKEDLKNRF